MILGIDGFFYLTERIILCPYPVAKADSQSDEERENSKEDEEENSLLSQIAGYLNSHHSS
jgi:hypothetical protein